MNGITVRELMRNKEHFLGRAAVIGGKEGLDRVVTSVNVMEVPDIVEWVRPGDLLLTTAYPIKDNVQEQVRLIPQLTKKNVAALAVKTKRFLSSLPTEMIEMANIHKLPLLELTPDAVFSTIISEVTGEILHEQSKTMTEVYRHIQSLTSFLAAGGDIRGFLDILSSMLQKPVTLFFSNGHVISSHDVPPESLAAFDLNAPSESLCVPILREHETVARLLCWNVRSPGSPAASLILQHAAQLIGLQIASQRSIHRVEQKYREEFLRKWLSGTFPNQEETLRSAAFAGISLHGSYRVGVVPLPEDERIRRTPLARLERHLLQKEILVLSLGAELAVFIPEEEAEAGLADRLHFVLQELEHILGLPHPRLGLSRSQPILCVDRGYSEAREALEIFSVVEPDTSLCRFEQLGYRRAVHKLARDPDLRNSILEIIKPLIQYDKKNGTQLLETLSTYFQHDGHVRKTADALFCHYNSVLYRIERIQSLLNVRLDDPVVKFQLLLAIRVWQYDRQSRKEINSSFAKDHTS